MPLAVGSLVWEKWRNDWYMGQVVAVEGGDEDGDEGNEVTRVRIHVHGESETRDKWLEPSSANLIELVQVEVKETAVGTFPQAGDTVELLVMDEPLARESQRDFKLLAGVVNRVYPARDASVVDVAYPTSSAFEQRRRVCVSNGYIRIVPPK